MEFGLKISPFSIAVITVVGKMKYSVSYSFEFSTTIVLTANHSAVRTNVSFYISMQ
jgi:hypothetical protein